MSAAADGQIKVWKRDSDLKYPTYSLVQEFGDHHLKSVTTLTAATGASSSVFVSGSSDGHLSFWALDPHEPSAPVSLVNDSDIDMSVLPLASAITALPAVGSESSDEYLVAIGNTSRNTYIYAGSPAASFKIAAKLEGQGDWVRALAFSPAHTDGSLLLASGCQDRYIRIWSITPGVDTSKRFAINDGTEALTDAVDPTYDESTGQLSNKVYELATATPYSMKFDALIIGHDDWIYSLKWHPSSQEPCLMSSSADSSIMIWSPDELSGVWLSKTQLGDITIKGASTATGAYGGMWYATWIGKQNDTIVSLANTGAWKKWSLQQSGASELWQPELGISGHTKAVTDIDWSPDGSYLLSSSLDKTTRLYAPWLTGTSSSRGWYEMARPQIHGYDMMSVRSLAPNLFVSAGDEKVLRVFSLTKSVATLLHNLVGTSLSQLALQSASESAAVPALGLSNKAVEESSEPVGRDEDGEAVQTLHEEDQQIGTAPVDNVNIATDRPPLEDQLQRLTLFPEVEKIYGHGYEVTTLAVPCKDRGLDKYLDESIVLSACKANTLAHGVIRITDTKTWQRDFEPLSHHSLTVTGIEFSQDDRYVLSVSRDRTWALWERKPETVPLPAQRGAPNLLRDESVGEPLFDLVHTSKAHTRIIWDCCWVHFAVPGPYYFLTASRDRTVRLWTRGNNAAWILVHTLELPAPVTAVAVSKGTHLLAAGLDTGAVHVFALEFSSTNEFVGVAQVQAVDAGITPTARVNTLAWNPCPSRLAEKGGELLAVASDDHSVCVLRVCS